MLNLTFLLFVPLSLLTTAAANVQEKHTIKIKEIGAGESWRVESKFKDSAQYKETYSLDKKMEQRVLDYEGSKHYSYSDTIIKWDTEAKAPAKLNRTYEKAREEGTAIFGGKRQGVLIYEGKSVILAKAGFGYSMEINGAPKQKKDITLDPGQVFVFHYLKKAFAQQKAVALNESWSFDPNVIYSLGKLEVERYSKYEGVSKLVKVYKKDGRLFGIVETVITQRYKGTDNGFDVISTFDGCIDGSIAEGRITWTARQKHVHVFEEPEGGLTTVTTTGAFTVEQVWAELPKK